MLVGGLLAHGLSANQTSEQKQTPPLVRALDIWYLFWRAQQQGQGFAEVEIIGSKEVLKGRIDADAWRRIRGILIEAKWLICLDRGQNLLSRDLHEISHAMLVAVIRAEPKYNQLSEQLNRQRQAFNLLRITRDQEEMALDTPLAILFTGGESK